MISEEMLASVIIHLRISSGGAPDVTVISVGNEPGNTNSNPGWGWLHFTSC